MRHMKRQFRVKTPIGSRCLFYGFLILIVLVVSTFLIASLMPNDTTAAQTPPLDIDVVTQFPSNQKSLSTNNNNNNNNPKNNNVDKFHGFTETDMIWHNIPTVHWNESTQLIPKSVDLDKSLIPGKTSFAKCGLNKQIILWTGHHKTGSTVFNSFNKYLVGYCHKNLNKSMQFPIKRDYKVQWMRWSLVVMSQQLRNLKKRNPSLKFYFVNLLRDPVSAILSGFNYHSKIPFESVDPWLNKSISMSLRTKCIYENDQILNETIKYAIEIFGHTIGSNLMNIESNTRVNIFYDKMSQKSLKFALFIEYQRFKCFEWNDWKNAFNIARLIKNRNERNQYNIEKENNIESKNSKNLNISVFKDKRYFDTRITAQFEKNIENAVNIKFEYFFNFANLNEYRETNETNNQIGKNIQSLYNFDNSALKLLRLIPSLPIREYDKIALEWKKNFDISSKDEKWIARNKHVTKGKFDKSLQIESLLSNPKTCNDLKQKSRQIDYWWLYPQFC